jgi:hypothetical protein
MAITYPNRVPRGRDTVPYLLTTGTTPLSVTIAGGVISAPAQFPTRDLMNTLHVPVEVTELNFMAVGAPAGTLTGAWEVSLALGSRMIAAFCPLAALTVRRDAKFFESILNAAASSLCYRWILPQPLIVAPNEGFTGLARITSAIPVNDGTFSLVMVARGRRMPQGTPVPRTRAIPYATGMIFPRAGVLPADNVFLNIFQKTLHVTAINLGEVSGAVPAPNTADQVTAFGPGGLANAVLRPLVTATAAPVLFGPRASIEVGHDLDPGESYQFSFPSITVGVHSPAIALVGWREEA